MALVTFNYSVTDSVSGAALAGVHCWASSDDGGQTVLDTADTNALGVASFSLEEGADVFLWTAFAGYSADNNPDVETVVADATVTGTMTAIVEAVPDAVVLEDTVLNLVTDALTEAGVLGQGETAESHDASDALRQLNHLLDSWRLQRLLCHKIDIARHTLTVDQKIHTIGPSGDFLAERPTRITKANIIITSDDEDAEEYRYPLQICETAREWAAASNQDITADIPSVLYCDYAFPDANLYLWPVPSVAYDLELFTWHKLPRFTSLSQKLQLPPGYYDALMLSLAERLCTRFGVVPEIRAQISADASLARKRIIDVNVSAPRLKTIDSGMPTTEGL